jgi:AcrR family transcriptional regulator
MSKIFNRLEAMGNREALLDGAKRCLLEKGFSRTTARDIASASGVSLAAIGYHFGTKEALLTAALINAIEDLDVEFQQAATVETNPNATPLERFESKWSRLIDSIAAHRQLWAANFEIFAEIDRIPAVRELIEAGLVQRARSGLVSLFEEIDETRVGAQSMQTTGSVYYALLTGVMVQWLIDPKHAPSGGDLAEGMKAISASFNSTSKKRTTRKPTQAKKRTKSR